MNLFFILDQYSDAANDYVMMDILITSLSILGGAILFLVIWYAVRAPGKKLNNTFLGLGTLKGKTYEEIVHAAGSPNAVSASVDKDGNPIKVCQWIATNYHIVLLFDQSDICLGVSSEVAV
jgi:hypothetical protein